MIQNRIKEYDSKTGRGLEILCLILYYCIISRVAFRVA